MPSTTTGTGAGATTTGGGSAGGALMAALMAMSDARLKRDVEYLGSLPSGLPVYRFRYLGDDAEQLGVMAQEAMRLFPAAVHEIGGWLAVDYDRIG